MKITDIKQLGSDVKRLTAETRATGPKTEAGKLKSVLNATRHGLARKNLLLPGEDPVEYETRMDEFFSTLAPKDEGEAQLVALDEVRGRRDDEEISSSTYTKVFETCRMLMATLLDMGRDQDVEHDVELDRLRAGISGIALPDVAELKKLGKYRAMLELSLGRRLASLEQLRKRTADKVEGEKDVERAKEFRVRMRMVA